MASTAAVPFWRSAGMTYITYSNICANLVRNCLKEPYKSEAISREKVHFSVTKWADGKPEKPSKILFSFKLFPICCFSRSRVWLRHAIGDSVRAVV
ncbi:putative H(+)-transporting two-sector ATPase [Helianthus annuus]|nr:putative H(+)-transporting two-sector ATPase [Helianthus annuus]KAJ0701431.1 putative H(+)-transporting two-sector ATPase [Helianthus annuus]